MRVRRRKVIKLNPYTLDYEITQEDFEIVQNPYSSETNNKGKYVFAKDAPTYNEYEQSYLMERDDNMCVKYNPYKLRYEKVPCDWEIQINPYTGEYEYGPKWTLWWELISHWIGNRI